MTKIITLEQAASTNTYLKELAAKTPGLENATTVWAKEQTAGRGQRGNSWESAPGLNLTFSMLIYPDAVDVSRQFIVSEAVAVAVAEVVQRHLPENKVEVKWPNDIYVGNRKIAGILIENSLNGRMIERSVAGIGVNINQREFVSDAPNPVSVFQITGTETPLQPLLGEMVAAVGSNFRAIHSPELHERYMSALWRGKGMHPYRDSATGEEFRASIDAVEPSGLLHLRGEDGAIRRYSFKEVVAIL